MMKLKVMLFGVLTAVSLGLVAPYASGADHSFTCEDIKKVSWMIATGNVNSPAKLAYTQEVVGAGADHIVFFLEGLSDKELIERIGLKKEAGLLTDWAMSLWDVPLGQVVIESFHRVNLLGSEYILEMNVPGMTYGPGDSFEHCLSVAMGNYMSSTQNARLLLGIE